jgi:hypothetical protein
MNETTRQHVWFVTVVVLATLNLSQFITNRTLRADRAKTQAEIGQLREQIDQGARRLVSNTLHARRQDVIAAGHWLHAFYQSDEGMKRPQGLWIDGHPDFDGIGAWLVDIYLAERFNGASDEAARQTIIDAIRQSDEWRQKHAGG